MDINQAIEIVRHTILVACLCGAIASTLLLLLNFATSMGRSRSFQMLKRSGGLVAMSIFAGAMIFNGYPTNADKKRAEPSSGWSSQQSSSAITQRSGGVDEGADGSFQVCIAADSAELPEFPVWTNALESLCVTGVAIGQTSVWLRVSWPSSEPPASGLIDIFLARDCDASTWTFGGSVPVPASTNEVVVAAIVQDSTIAATGRRFFRIAASIDSDGDGLTDAFELLVSHTSPDASDSDGDGVPDGWEYENGLDPNSWPDAYADPDGDGIPNLYEYHNGTQPQIADAGEIERIVAGGSDSNAVSTLSAALEASRPYSVIEIADGIYEGSGWSGHSITLPDYPVLITSSDGGRSRRAIIRHTEQLAAMYLNATQTTHTVVQGLCYDLAATNGMQMAFWCGGNLPWSGPPAGGMFRDIYVRMPNPGVEYEGWFFRHYESNEVVIASCTVNAHGATSARGIYAVDSPPMSVENCTFVNFPSNNGGLGYGIQYESTVMNWSGAPDPIPLEIVNCLFDASFTNAYALAPLENGVAYDVSMLNCVVPSPLVYEADFTDGLIVTNAGASFSGHLHAGSRARGAGLESLFAPLDIDGQLRPAVPDIGADQFAADAGALDTDGDGLSDSDEDWLYGTDPFFADSDWDSSPDNVEIANGTDPLDRLSHFANITLTVINTSASANLTNYYGFSSTLEGWDVTNVFAAVHSGYATLAVFDTTSLYGKAFSDLNRNGVYDEDADVISVISLESDRATVDATITLGDVDGDGVPDAEEREEQTDPYDAGNFVVSATISITDVDSGVGITNYISHSIYATNAIPQPETHFVSSSYSYDVSCLAVEGRVYVRGFRDLNRNGIYDEGCDAPFSYDLGAADRGRTILLTIGDSDSDTIVDSKEVEEGTSPVNRRSYCFNCELEICNVFSTTNYLIAEACMGTNRLYGPVVQTNNTLSRSFGHLTTASAESVTVYFWDDIDGDMERDSDEPCASVRTSAQTHDTSCRFYLSLGTFDADSDGLPDWWQDYYQLQDDAFSDTDSDGLINLHEWWAGTNPLVPDGSNTVLSVCCRSIDERIRGKTPSTALRKFSTYESGNWVANTNFWAKDVDTSCASFWNSTQGSRRAGTLLTKRHMLFANHYPPAIGSVIYFRGHDGLMYMNTISATARVGTTDILIALLATEMNSAVTPASVLSPDFDEYLRSGLHLPVCQFDYNEKALVYELALSLGVSVVNGKPRQGDRLAFYEPTKSGDSGDPVFLVLGDKVVLLGALHLAEGPVGDKLYERSISPFVTAYADDIQNVMDGLCAGYHLDFFDFSEYGKLPLDKGVLQ